MKQKITAIIRVLVSVSILTYLFNSIFQKEASGIAKQVLTATHASDVELAGALGIEVRYVQLIRQSGCKIEEDSVSLAAMEFRDRVDFIWHVGPDALWRVFRRVNPWWFVASILCVGGVCLLGILRWMVILKVQGLALSFGRATSIFFVGMFFNAFMLGSTGGDVIKAWYTAHETHHKKAEAVATVVVDRIIGLLALFVITLMMMAIFYHRVFDDVRLRVFAVITLGVVVGVVGLTALSFWRGFADKLPGLRQWLQRMPKYDSIRRMVEACRAYATHPGVLFKTMLMSFGVHVFAMLSIVCIGQGLHIVTKTGIIDYYLYLPIINTVSAMPVSISGFGVRELMYAEMFGEVGVTESQAVAMSLLGFIATLFWSVVGGGFFLTHRRDLPPTKEMMDAESSSTN